MADDSTGGGAGGFTVNPRALLDAVGTVSRERDVLVRNLELIKKAMSGLGEVWQTPSHQTFDALRRKFELAVESLMKILEDIIVRLRTVHENYVRAEQMNVAVLSGFQTGLGGAPGTN